MAEQRFDNTTKSFYRRLFSSWGIAVETERPVFARERTIDLVVECSADDIKRLQKTVFSYFRALNGIELKGPADPLTVKDHNVIMMRAWGLGGVDNKKKNKKTGEEQNPSDDIESATDESDIPKAELTYREEYRIPSNRTVTIISVVRPDKILNQLQKEIGFVPTDKPGIYHCDDHLPQWIIHPDELKLIPENYPLLALSRGKKLAAFIDLCIREGLTHYLELAVDVGVMTDPLVIWQKILEVEQMEQLMNKEVLQVMNEVFRRKPQFFMENFSFFRETLDESTRRSEEAGFKHGRLRSEQQTLIRQLRRKFKEVPAAVVRRVERTNDRKQLESWLDQILSANSLAEMNLLPANESNNGGVSAISNQ